MNTYDTCEFFLERPSEDRLLACVNKLGEQSDRKKFNDLLHWIDRQLFVFDIPRAEVYSAMWPKYFRHVEELRKELGELESDADGPTVVLAPALLSPIHAPTKAALEMCLGLEGEVWLFDTGSFPLEVDKPELPMSFMARRLPVTQLCETIAHGPQRVTLLHFPSGPFDRRIRNALVMLKEAKPQCLFSMQQFNLVGDVLAGSIPTVHMPTAEVWPMTCAQLRLQPREERSYDILPGQHDNNYVYNWIENVVGNVQGHFKKSDIGIDDDAKVYMVVGNRLDKDADESFHRTVRTILSVSPNSRLVVVGNCDQKPWPLDTVFLGHRRDLLNVLSLADVYLNPRRRGGGQTAYMAAMLGKPVVTYNYGDVGNMFQGCEQEPHYINMATHTDEKSGEKARRMAAAFPLLRDSTKELTSVVERVRDMA